MNLVATTSQETANYCSEGLASFGGALTTTAYDALCEALLKLTPSALFIDSALPGFNGPTSMRELCALSPLTKVIILSSGLSVEMEIALFIAGARGFCSTKSSALEIKNVFTAVTNGQLWMRRSNVAQLLEALRTRSHPALEPKLHLLSPLTGLTPREQEIAVLVGTGNTNKQIARHLAISERTVKAHLSEIFRKLSVTDRLTLGLRVTALSQPSPPTVPQTLPEPVPVLKLIKSRA